MSAWVEHEVWENLHGIFAHFDARDSWIALFKLMNLFERLSAEIAENLVFNSKEELSKNMTQFICRMSL